MKFIMYIGLVVFLLLPMLVTSQPLGWQDVTKHGIIGDGQTNNAKSIQRLINDVSIHGGTLYFPPGRYLTGSLELKNNITIHITAGATLLGSAELSDYEPHIPKLKSYNDLFLRYSLFYSEGTSNISIEGKGTIDGQGSMFKVVTTKKPERYMNRPYIIRFVECKNVRVEDVTMQNSAMWMQQYLACEDVYIHGLKVYNHANKNNDMIDIDGCKNVVMSDCIGDTDDDAITLKSTSPRVTENVTITNCVISSHCNAIKTGTESTGGFRNISISNIVIKPSSADTVITGHAGGISGITLATVDGGNLEGIMISNIRIDGPQVPIFLRLGNRARKYTENTTQPGIGTYRNVSISSIIATNVGSVGCAIFGLREHPLENISLRDISISFKGGATLDDSRKIIQESEDQYPEATGWGFLPAYAFYIRNVNTISLRDINVTFENPDLRPAVVSDNVNELFINGLKGETTDSTETLLRFHNTRNASVYASQSLSNVKYFLLTSGEFSKDISLIGNNMLNVKEAYRSDIPTINIKMEGNIYK